MSATRWSKFFWGDWRSDPRLKMCSLAARGLWMEMLCVAAEHDPPGYVAIDDKPLGPAELARLSGIDVETAASLVGELESAGVFSRDRKGCIYNRRMISDAKRAKIARKIGAKGGQASVRNRSGIFATLGPALDAPLKQGAEHRAGIQSPESTRTESRIVESNSTTPHASASTVPNGHDLEPTRRHGTAPDLDSDLGEEGAGLDDGANLEGRLRRAAGIEHVAAPWPADLRPIYALIGDGYDLDRDIVPALRGMAERATRARSWGYFERAIREHPPARAGPGPAAPLPPLSEAAKASLAGRVFVIWDTPAWDAWQRHYRSHNLIMPSPISRQHDHKNGWYFPTEWPPGAAGKEQAA